MTNDQSSGSSCLGYCCVTVESSVTFCVVSAILVAANRDHQSDSELHGIQKAVHGCNLLRRRKACDVEGTSVVPDYTMRVGSSQSLSLIYFIELLKWRVKFQLMVFQTLSGRPGVKHCH